jgi:hypothetical protein
MTSILKVDTIQNSTGGAPSATDLGIKPISVADQWRLANPHVGITNDWADVDEVWEQAETYSGNIGTSMSVSSGVFTFPETGLYYISGSGTWEATNTTDARMLIYALWGTVDNSTYVRFAQGFTHIAGLVQGNNTWAHCGFEYFFNVTNTTTHKIKPRQFQSNGNLRLGADSDITYTSLTFIRLGDAQ